MGKHTASPQKPAFVEQVPATFYDPEKDGRIIPRAEVLTHGRTFLDQLEAAQKQVTAARELEYEKPLITDYESGYAPTWNQEPDALYDPTVDEAALDAMEPDTEDEETFWNDWNSTPENNVVNVITAGTVRADDIHPGTVRVEDIIPDLEYPGLLTAGPNISIHNPVGVVTASENLIVPVGTIVNVNARGEYEVTPPLAGGLPGPDPVEPPQKEKSLKDELAEASTFATNNNTFFSIEEETETFSVDFYFTVGDELSKSITVTGPAHLLAKTLKVLLAHG